MISCGDDVIPSLAHESDRIVRFKIVSKLFRNASTSNYHLMLEGENHVILL